MSAAQQAHARMIRVQRTIDGAWPAVSDTDVNAALRGWNSVIEMWRRDTTAGPRMKASRIATATKEYDRLAARAWTLRTGNPADKTKAKFARELHTSQRKQRAAKLGAAKVKSKTARAAAISSCKAGRVEAKTACERARVPAREARAERERIAQENRELRAAEKTRKGLRPLKRTSAEARQESDAEVIANLEGSHPAYVAAFKRIRHGIKASPNRSRTEAAIELIEQDPDLMREIEESQFDAGEAMMRRRYANPKKWPMVMGGNYPAPAYLAGDIIANAPAAYVGARLVRSELPTPYTFRAQPGRAYLYRIVRMSPSGDEIIDWIPEESIWEVKRGKRKVKGPYQPPWAAPRTANPDTSNGRDALPKGKRAAFKAFHWGNDSTKEQSVKVPDPRSADLYALGAIVEIVYETTKGKERAEYEHKTRARPLLLCDAKDPHAFFIAVSPMKNTTRGIVG